MNKSIKKMTITGCCIALGIILPMAFHMIPNAGSIFLPMHIPVLLWWYFMRLAVRRDLRHFNPIFIVNLYRDATGSYVACDDV